jgi:hypothetical protein
MSKERSNCTVARLKWLLSEYKEPVKLTKIEYYILKWAKENTEFKYLVRLKNGNLCAYSENLSRIISIVFGQTKKTLIHA